MELTEEGQTSVDTAVAEDREKLLGACKTHGIPDYMWEGVCAHVLEGRKVGDFLTAIFNLDFMEIATRADDNNLHCLVGYARLLYNDVPIAARGKENASHWRSIGGMRGYYTSQLQPKECAVDEPAEAQP